MRKIITAIIFSFTVAAAHGQSKLEKETRAIEIEGKRLYQSEMASWYGTDLFLNQYVDKDNIGAYFSYTEGDTSKCIFYSKGTNAQVIGTIAFDSSYNVQTASLNLVPRPFTPKEKMLYTLRENAKVLMETDTFFKHYENTSLNLIPVMSDGEKKVYVLTGPSQDGVVIFGNDYLISFNDANKIIDKQRLHHNIISMPYGQKGQDSIKTVGAIHNHIPPTSEFITPTDICTLMLYERFTGWGTYTVMSEDYMSLWNCKSNRLVILTTKAIKRIDEDQKRRHPKQ